MGIGRRTRSAPQERHRPQEGQLWTLIGVALIVGTLVASVFLYSASPTAGVVFLLVSLVAAGGARSFLHRGRRLSAPEAHAVLAPEVRAALEAAASTDAAADPAEPGARPVVYLRSFEADETPYVPTLFSRRHRRVLPRGFFLLGYAVWLPKTHEERMANALKSVGPVVAIGDPRDRLPDLGAARLYVDDGDWQSKIIRLIERAELVVVETDASEGLLWEVDQVVQHVPCGRLVLSIPVTKGARPRPERYEEFRRSTSNIFPKPLPAEIGDAQFVVFDEDWNPEPFSPTLKPSAEELAPRPDGATPQRVALEGLREEFRLHTRRFVLRLVPYGVLLALVIAVVVLFAVDSGGDSYTSAPSSAAPAQPSWHRVGQRFGFSVLVPGNASESLLKREVNTAQATAVVRTHSLSFRTGLFKVGYTRLPAPLLAALGPRTVVLIAAKSYLNATHPRRVTGRYFSLEGMLGYRYRAELPDATVIEGRAYLRGRSLYELIGIGRSGSPQLARVHRFLRSFQIVA